MPIFPLLVVTIGFDPEDYVVGEVDGEVSLIVRLLDGALERTVTVQFTTAPDSATDTGKF